MSEFEKKKSGAKREKMFRAMNEGHGETPVRGRRTEGSRRTAEHTEGSNRGTDGAEGSRRAAGSGEGSRRAGRGSEESRGYRKTPYVKKSGAGFGGKGRSFHKPGNSLAAVEADIAAATARAEAEEAAEAAAAAAAAEEAGADEVNEGFDTLEIDERILRATKDMGFEQMSPIQAQAIPLMLSGRDMIGQAQTGTGKTAAFGIPLLQKTDSHEKHLQAVVLCPTRELAIQVADEIRNLAKFMHGVKVLPIYGGQEISTQIRSLKGGVQIVVGTPGRVMDHMRRGTLKLETIHTIVLDEADEMLDMGFVDDIKSILSETPEERQTVLFSATMPQPIMDIAEQFQKDAELVRVVKKELTVPQIEQYYYDVRPNQKTEALCRLLDMYNPKLSLVFCNTKSKVDSLAEELKGRGYFAEGLHGDLSQAQRDRVMNGFRRGATNILVATDVAARGIDVDNIEAVFNYDLPQDDEYYVHRIGRTGRAGKDGIAFTFVVGKEVYKLRDIQRYCKTKIKARPLPSENEVTAIKADKILDQVGELIEKVDLKDMINLIEEKINDKDYSAMDVAAAFLKMSMGEGTSSEQADDPEFADTGAAEEGMVRLFINIGKES